MNNEILTFEQFVCYYEKFHRFPDNSYISPKGYNEQQFRTKYKRFLSSQKKRKEKSKKTVEKQRQKNVERASKLDEKWEHLKEIVDKRDGHSCRLFKLLSIDEKKSVQEYLHNRMKTIDRAHIFRRSKYIHMKYMAENVVCLYRLFHSRLDSFCDPLTGIAITSEEVDKWWRRIVGEEKYNWLENISRNKHPLDKF